MTPLSLTVCSELSSDHLPVLIDNTCRSSFLTLPDRPDFKRADWTKFQECLEEKLPTNPELHDKEAVDACVGDLSSAIPSAIEESPVIRPAATYYGFYPGRNTPEETAAEVVAGNQEPGS